WTNRRSVTGTRSRRGRLSRPATSWTEFWSSWSGWSGGWNGWDEPPRGGKGARPGWKRIRRAGAKGGQDQLSLSDLARERGHRPPQVPQQFSVGATGVLKGVGQDRQVAEAALVVDRLSDLPRGPVVPREAGGIVCDGAEGDRPEDAAEEGGLGATLPVRGGR